jgi:hypothetical protein
MHIALRELKIDTGATGPDGKRALETRQPGEAVPEAAGWGNPGVWIMRGDITDAEGFVWRNRKRTGEQLTVGEVAASPPDPTPDPPPESKALEAEPEPAASKTVVLGEADAGDPVPLAARVEEELAAIEIPTLEQLLELGYSDRQAAGVIAHQTALAAGAEPETADKAAFAALDEWDEAHPEDDGGDDEPSARAAHDTSDGAAETAEASGRAADDASLRSSETAEPSGLEARQDDDDQSSDLGEPDGSLGAPAPSRVSSGDGEPEPSRPTSSETDPAAGGTQGPNPEPPPKLTRKQLGKMTKAQLVEAAVARGLKASSRARNSDLAKAILAAQD